MHFAISFFGVDAARRLALPTPLALRGCFAITPALYSPALRSGDLRPLGEGDGRAKQRAAGAEKICTER